MPIVRTLAGRSTPVTGTQRTPAADVGTDAVHRDLDNWSANLAIEVRLALSLLAPLRAAHDRHRTEVSWPVRIRSLALACQISGL